MGIIDIPKVLNLLEWTKGVDLYKQNIDDPLNKAHTSMVRYWNFYLTQERNIYFRVRYNLMRAIGEVGGVLGMFSALLAYLLKPFYYNKNELEVM